MTARISARFAVLTVAIAALAAPGLASANDSADAKVDATESAAAPAPNTAAPRDLAAYADLWNTGTLASVDARGERVYIMKSRLVPASRADLTAASNRALNDPFVFNNTGVVVPRRTLGPRPASAPAARPSGGARRAPSISAPRAAPRAPVRRSGGAVRYSDR